MDDHWLTSRAEADRFKEEHSVRTTQQAFIGGERAHIHDPRVCKLADKVIEAQVREINDMKALIADRRAQPTPNDAPLVP